MIGKEMIEQEEITIPKVKEYLEERQKEAEEDVKEAKEKWKKIKAKKEKENKKNENKCPICGEEFSSARGMKIHRSQAHTEEEIELADKKEEDMEKKIEEEAGMKYEQNLSLQYAQEFGNYDSERTEKAVEELKEMGIDGQTAVELINLMPEKEEQINLVFEKKRFDIEKDQVKKVLKIVEDLRESE